MTNSGGWWAARRRSREVGAEAGNAVRWPVNQAKRGGARDGWGEPVPVGLVPDEGFDLESRLLRFPHLDVAVLDGVVYTTTRGLSPLGPLAGATASSRRLPVTAEAAGAACWMGNGTIQKMERTAVAVVSGLCSHQLVIDHNSTSSTAQQVERQVAQFNVLAVSAQR